MNNKWILSILIYLVAFVTSFAMASDLSTEWSSVNNPNGEWSYGWLSSNCDSYTVYNFSSDDSSMSNWHMDSGDYGKICKSGSKVYKDTSIYLEVNQVAFTGGGDDFECIGAVRWLASKAGVYEVNAHYTAQKFLGSSSIVYIIKQKSDGSIEYLNSNGSKGEQLDGFIGTAANKFADGFGKSKEYLYKSVIAIVDGEALYFAVYNNSSDDMTGIQVTIDPYVFNSKLSSSGGSYTITGSTSPQLGTTNLMTNGDMELGVSSPNVWQSYSTGSGVVNEWSSFAYSGNKSLYSSTEVPTSYGSWGGGSRVIVPASQELLFSYYINMPWGTARPYAVCYYDVNGDGTNNLTDYETYYQGFTTVTNPLYPEFIDDLNYFSDKHLSAGWNRVSRIISARSMNFSTAGAIFAMYYADPGALETPSEMWIDKTYLGITNVNLTVTVYGILSNITEIKVYNDENILSYTAPNIPVSGTSYSFTIPVLADSHFYKIVVKDINGSIYNKVIQ